MKFEEGCTVGDLFMSRTSVDELGEEKPAGEESDREQASVNLKDLGSADG